MIKISLRNRKKCIHENPKSATTLPRMREYIVVHFIPHFFHKKIYEVQKIKSLEEYETVEKN